MLVLFVVKAYLVDSAADVVNNISVHELEKIIREVRILFFIKSCFSMVKNHGHKRLQMQL